MENEIKVYITFGKDGYNGEQIEKVFLNEADAQDYIIKTRYKGTNRDKYEVEEMALDLIEEHEVIGGGVE